MKHFTAAPAAGKLTETFRAGKGQVGLREDKLNSKQNGSGNEDW